MSSPGILEPVRRNQPREMLMVSEWLNQHYQFSKWATRVRLGQPTSALPSDELSDDEKSILQVYARWADAIIFDTNKVSIVEAKIRPNLGPLEALLTYKNIFLSDPAFAEHHKKRIELIFLYAIEDPVHLQLARQLGIIPVQYKPDWLQSYMNILTGRERRAPRSG